MENENLSSTTLRTFIRFENYRDISDALTSKLCCTIPTIDKLTKQFSIDIWFMPENNEYELISTGNLKLFVVSNKYAITINDSVYAYDMKDDIKQNTWNNIFLTFDGSNVLLYSNLVQITVHDSSIATNSIKLDKSVSIGNNLKGVIKCLRIYDKPILQDNFKNYIFKNSVRDSTVAWISSILAEDKKVKFSDLTGNNTTFTPVGLCIPTTAFYGVMVAPGDFCNAGRMVDLGIAQYAQGGFWSVVYIKFFHIKSDKTEQILYSMGQEPGTFNVSLTKNNSASILKICNKEIPVEIKDYTWNDVVVFLNMPTSQTKSLVILNGEYVDLNVGADYKFSYSGTSLGYGNIAIGNTFDGSCPFSDGVIESVALYEGIFNLKTIENLHINGPNVYDDCIRALYSFGLKVNLVNDECLLMSQHRPESPDYSFKVAQSTFGLVFGIQPLVQITTKTQSQYSRNMATNSALDNFYGSIIQNILVFCLEESGIDMSITPEGAIALPMEMLKELEDSSIGRKIREAMPSHADITIPITPSESSEFAKKLKRKHFHTNLFFAKSIIDPELVICLAGTAIIIYITISFQAKIGRIIWDATRNINNAQDQIRIVYKKLSMLTHAMQWFDLNNNKKMSNTNPVAWKNGGLKEPQLFSAKDFSMDKEMEVYLEIQLYPPLSVSKSVIDLKIQKLEIKMEAIDSTGAIVNVFDGILDGVGTLSLPSPEQQVPLRGITNNIGVALYQYATEYKITTKITESIGTYVSNSLIIKLDLYSVPDVPLLPSNFGPSDPRAKNTKTLPYNNPHYYIDADVMKIIAHYHPKQSENAKNQSIPIGNIKHIKDEFVINNTLKYERDAGYAYITFKVVSNKDVIIFDQIEFSKALASATAANKLKINCYICAAFFGYSIRLLFAPDEILLDIVDFECDDLINTCFFIKGNHILVGNERNSEPKQFGRHSILKVSYNDEIAIFDPTFMFMKDDLLENDDYPSDPRNSFDDVFKDYIKFVIDGNIQRWRKMFRKLPL